MQGQDFAKQSALFQQPDSRSIYLRNLTNFHHMSHIPVFIGTSFVREANHILLLTSHTVLLFRICKIWASFSFLHALLTRIVPLKCLYSKICHPPFLGFLGLPPSPQFVLIILAISSNPCCPGSVLSLEASSLITFFHFLCPWAALQSPQTSPLYLFFPT